MVRRAFDGGDWRPAAVEEEEKGEFGSLVRFSGYISFSRKYPCFGLVPMFSSTWVGPKLNEPVALLKLSAVDNNVVIATLGMLN